MNDYQVTITLPLRATDDRAAASAQLAVFQQLRLFLSRGIFTEEFEIDPPKDEEFTTRTRLEKI